MSRVALWPSAGLACALVLSPPSPAQELPLSGHFGLDVVYATAPDGSSQLFQLSPALSPAPIPLGDAVAAVPSRWAHRRRTLGALETAIAWAPAFVLITPMGDAVGNGALHLVDGRGGFPPSSLLVPTGNPAGYDVALAPQLGYAFAAEDDGQGGTTLRGFSYATAGSLTPLAPPSLSLPGPPAAYVQRMDVSAKGALLHVPTAAGVQLVELSANAPQMSLGGFLSSGAASPASNPARFLRKGKPSWILGTASFDAQDEPVGAGFMIWNESGAVELGDFGALPGSTLSWIPAVGCEELAVVGDGTDTYAYFLLREPPPGTFFIKPAAIGVVRLLGDSAAVASTIACPESCGEPFGNPSVSGTRVALQSSFGPPFTYEPPGGGEKLSILYTPLDPLGTQPDGRLAVPAPLGGRISTKGMDRPVWSRDGSRVFAATSWFPGAPSPGLPGLEVLDVPADVPLDAYAGPHTVLPNAHYPNQSLLLPGSYRPRFPAFAGALEGLSFYGAAFDDGLAALGSTPFGDVGQQQPALLEQDPHVPGFPSILPPAFEDATLSKVPVPAHFGARRPSFNLLRPDLGVLGLTMTAALGDTCVVQATGFNTLAALGVFVPAGNLVMLLPDGWVTTSEFLSL